jgi:hypothetical protein
MHRRPTPCLSMNFARIIRLISNFDPKLINFSRLLLISKISPQPRPVRAGFPWQRSLFALRFFRKPRPHGRLCPDTLFQILRPQNSPQRIVSGAIRIWSLQNLLAFLFRFIGSSAVCLSLKWLPTPSALKSHLIETKNTNEHPQTLWKKYVWWPTVWLQPVYEDSRVSCC